MSSRFALYRDALAAISTRTGSPLPSLIFSFAVLHELTAVVPLVAIFYTARGLQVGERAVNQFVHDDERSTGWASRQFSQWLNEGETWANRVGRRYGIFGFEKGATVDSEDRPRLTGQQLAGDIANAVLAYGATKALLPVRIGMSLYLSPAFSRGIIEPIRRRLIRPFQRKKENSFWYVIYSEQRNDDFFAAPVVAKGFDEWQSNKPNICTSDSLPSPVLDLAR